MNLSWNQLAKTANQLAKQAQKRIDTVLDIKDDGEGSNVAGESSGQSMMDIDLLSPSSMIANVEDSEESIHSVAESTSSQSTATVVKQPEIQNPWDNTWTTSELVVDSEPNPMRDQVLPAETALVNHSPSSNSNSDEGSRDLPGSPEKKAESSEEHSSNDEIHKMEPIREQLDSTNFSSSRRSSRQDDSLTIASSDIEVVRNMDTWSVASVTSSRPATDQLPTHHIFSHKANYRFLSIYWFSSLQNEHSESLRAQLQLAEKRMQELRNANDGVTRANAELQQRIATLNQQQQAAKKEVEEKAQNAEELRKEGIKLAEQNGKQMKEIRRLRNELNELEKVKNEKKKLKEEKTKVEETLEQRNETITELKENIKSLESKLDTVEKENNSKFNNQETVRKQVTDLQVKIEELQSKVTDLTSENETYKEANQALSKELVDLNNRQWEKMLAGERMNESAIMTNQELAEVRAQNERMRKEMRDLEKRLEDALHDKSSVVAHISSASAPLLEEINELKSTLFAEQTSSEEMFEKLQKAQKEVGELKTQLRTAEKTSASLLLKHHDEEAALNAKCAELEKQLQRMAQEHKSTIERLLKEKNRETELYEELRREHTKMQAEQEQIRKNLRNQSEENASLQSEVSMLKKKLKEAATTVVLPQFPSLPAQIPTSTSSGNISSFEEQNPIIIRKQDDIPPETSPVDFIGSSLASFPNYDGRVNPLQVELESVVGQYQTSLRRIVLLESEMGKIAELQKENGNLKTKLQENVRNYDELLELDGERLERIEELQQDVLDLRELLRNQMLVFAEAQTRKMQTENESISIQDDEQ